MYKIGELSKLCNISVKALRYYDAEGLLIPDEIDKFTGYRYYSAAKLADCYRIIALKELGFSLDEIRTQLATDDNQKIMASLEAKLTELNGLRQTTETQVKRIEHMRNNLSVGENKLFNIIVRDTDELRIAFVRKNYRHKADALRQSGEIARALPRFLVGKRRIIINYEIEYREEDFDLAACAEILGPLPPSALVSERTLFAGGKVASLVCTPAELDDAYKAMIKHLNRSHYKACDAYYEIYHDDHTVELKVPVQACTKDVAPAPEEVDLSFVDDPAVCGKWEMIDVLPTREHFVYGKPKCGNLAWLRQLYFIDGGKPYWVVQGWTKGTVFTYDPKPGSVSAKRYTLETHEGHQLLFLEINDYRRGTLEGGSEIWVYEKVEDRHYLSPEEFRRCDKVDYPFSPDEAVLGVWHVRDYLTNVGDFDPNRQNRKREALFVQQIEFKDHGACTLTTSRFSQSVTHTWTRGLVLNKHIRTASAYEIRKINGQEYLFMEWKSGDYSFGGFHACWYVFTRE